METKGDTEWLKNGAPHCHVRHDFIDSDRGVMKLSDVVDVADDEIEASQCYYYSCHISATPHVML
jgi:hypothetical protein